MTTIAIHQSQYIPWAPYIKKIYQSDIFVVMDNVQFQRRGVQNRNSISDGKNEILLTIAVSKKQSEHINEKLIPHLWGKKHYKSLQSAYGKSPFWEKYHIQLQHLYADDYPNLHELNMAFLLFIFNTINLPLPNIVTLSSMKLSSKKSDLILEACQALNATKYISGLGAKNYLNLPSFENAGIDIIFKESKPAIYQPGKRDYMVGLSILDMLFFCSTSEIKQYLISP